MFRSNRLPIVRLPFHYIVLAGVLLIGVALPVSAKSDSSSTQTSGTITLSDSDCGFNNFRPAQIDLGTWKWDGLGYQRETGAEGSPVHYAVSRPQNRPCQITIKTEGLFHTETGSAAHIGPDHLAVHVVRTPEGNAAWEGFGTEGVVVIPAEPRVNFTGVSIALMSVPNDIPPGTYKGEFEFTISVGP